ncbi:hypothetical protein LTR08_001806 [Meristemomyces frigidus]|nr:hypothetical protein LTR08_001806 [Meristemomyces frigidus]
MEPGAFCPPSCTAPRNLTTTQNVTVSDCTSTTTRWGRHTNTVTTTASAQPTQCPYRITVTAPVSACPSNSTVTTTAAPTACPYRVTETTTLTATHNYTSTVTRNVTTRLTQSYTSTVTATPTPSPPAYAGPFVNVLAFASTNCSNAGAVSEGYPPAFARYQLTIPPTSNSSACTRFTSPVGSIAYSVDDPSSPTNCSLNFYASDQCVSDSVSAVVVDGQDGQCWAFAGPRSMRLVCAGA